MVERPTSVIANAAMLLRMVFILLVSGLLSVKGLCFPCEFAGRRLGDGPRVSRSKRSVYGLNPPGGVTHARITDFVLDHYIIQNLQDRESS
jgi:hypothetical protein